ncbi:MAG: TonB-dependent receptor plug domain-containing protein [Candidatus Binatia bacterium]
MSLIPLPLPLWERRYAVTLALVLAIILLCSSLIRAQDPFTTPQASEQKLVAPTTGALEEVLLLLHEETVVTAARHAQPLSEAPSNVYVITAEDIRHSGATDVPTILRRIPGIDVLQMNSASFSVSARGDNQLSANKMLVLVDGRSIYEDVQGGVSWKALPVTLLEIQRIEVLKGPASAVYGFNAYDGVINIITKSPEEMRGATFQFAGGDLGTIAAAATLAGTHGSWGYRLSASRDQNDQWRRRHPLAFRSHTFNLQAEYHLPDHSFLRLRGGMIDVNRDANQFASDIIMSRVYTHGSLDLAYERENFTLRTWWTTQDATGNVRPHPLLPAGFLHIHQRTDEALSQTGTQTYNVEFQHTITWGPTQRLIYGANYRHITLSANYTKPHFNTEERLGLFFQHEWRIAPQLLLNLGLRYDLDDEIPPTVSPRIALLYTPIAGHTFRISGSVAFRPPTLVQTYLFSTADISLPLPPPYDRLTNSNRGSHSVDPEKIITYEIGYQGWFLRHRARLRADLFLNHLSQLIDLKQTGPTSVTYANQGKAEIGGGEIGGEFQFTPWLSGFANYAGQAILFQTFINGARRSGPQYRINIGLRGEWDNGLSLNVLWHYAGTGRSGISGTFREFAPFGVVRPKPTLSPYSLLNLRVAYRFWNDRVEVAISVFNALNDRHREHPLTEVIGHRVVGWLNMRF